MKNSRAVLLCSVVVQAKLFSFSRCTQLVDISNEFLGNLGLEQPGRRDWAQRAPTATVPTTAPEAIPTGRRMSYLPLLRAIGLLRGLKNQKSVPHPNKIV